jgi:hypothetical protein
VSSQAVFLAVFLGAVFAALVFLVAAVTWALVTLRADPEAFFRGALENATQKQKDACARLVFPMATRATRVQLALVNDGAELAAGFGAKERPKGANGAS